MKRTATVLLLGILFGISSNSFAQTTYQSDPGFFTPIVKSLYLRGGVFEDAQLIGPAVGYRFNESYDVTVHTEFLSMNINSITAQTLKRLCLTLELSWVVPPIFLTSSCYDQSFPFIKL